MTIIKLLFCITIIVVMCAATFSGTYWKEKLGYISIALLVCLVISTLFCGLIYSISYHNFLDLKENQVNLKSAYNRIPALYAKFADAPSGVKGGQVASDFTDHKYQDYQNNLNWYVRQYYFAITDYNATLKSKELLAESTFWGPLIYYPEKLEYVEVDMN